MTVPAVLDAVLRDSVFFEESQGGVTFSGGEPLMQFAFLKALLEACRICGIRTAVDTCGQARTHDLLEIAPLTDLFLFDLKLMDDQAHQRYTGCSNQLILENLRELGRVHSFIWLRVPLVAGINDSPAQLEAAARFAASVPGVRLVNVLPFHRIGAQKLQGLGRDEPKKGNKSQRVSNDEIQETPQLQTPSAESIARALTIFHRAGLAARKGG